MPTIKSIATLTFSQRFFAIAALLVALPQWLFCENAAPVSQAPQISFITCAPGRNIYELEGHEALRLQFADGRDFIVNWGLFDFDSPNFVYRFVKGETDYCVGVAPTSDFLHHYRRYGRGVVQQEVNLTESQASRALELIEENLRPENRVYRYNYVYDNCATRPLKIIEAAIGDTITLGSPSPAAAVDNPTFRKIMTSYHRNYPWYQFGIDMALGTGIDKPIGRRELTFAPEALAAMLADATVTDSLGTGRPLIGATTELTAGSDATLGPTPLWLTPQAAAWAVFALALLLTAGGKRCRKAARLFDATFMFLVGLTGWLVVFLVFVSVHEATSPNWLLLWLNPLAWTITICVWLKKAKRVVICYQFVNFVALLTLLIVGMAGVQSLNRAFWPLIGAEMLRSLTYFKTDK